MAATIKIKNSSTAGAAPTSSDLVQGELAVNVTDKRLFTENSGGTVVELGTNPSSITLPDGSASAPTLLHSGDTNTGLFFPAADTIALTTGGTERLRLDSSGNLGLGVTPSGNYQLQAGSGSGAAGRGFSLMTLAGGYSGGDYPIFGYNFRTTTTGGSYLYNASDVAAAIGFSSVITFNTASSGTAGNQISFSERMRLDASGNLGVGTTSPQSYSNYKILHVAGPATNGSGLLYFTNSNNSLVGIANADGANSLITFGSQTNHPIRFATNDTERARIDTSGNLLVAGTSTSGINSAGGFYVERNSLQTYTMTSHASGAGNGAPYSYFYLANAYLGQISQSGTTGVNFTSASDYRLKNIDGALTGYKERLFALQPKQGSWKSDGSEFRGFLAHEFAMSYPTSVVGEKDEVDNEGKPKYQSMQASSAEVIADLVAYIKELETRLSALEQA